jgi:predicted dehydrogenase
MTDLSARPVRAVVIGCGAIAYEHLPYLAASPRCDLVAVVDHSPAMAAAAVARFGKGAAYSDSAQMLAEAKPDVVHVLTPPQTHDALVRQALAAGAHVVCEKPMTNSAEETAGLLAAAQQAGRMLIESRNLLFNDPVQRISALNDAGALGRVIECDVLLSLDFLAGPFGDLNLSGPGVALKGGAVHDFLPHLAYLFLHFTGTTDTSAAQIRGVLANRSGNPRCGYDFLDALIDNGDTRGRLRIARDVGPDQFRFYLRGTKASVEADLYNPYVRLEGPPNVGKRASFGLAANGKSLIGSAVSNLRNKIMQNGTYQGIPRMLDAFYQSVQESTPPPFSPEDMIATARFVDHLLALGDAT